MKKMNRQLLRSMVRATMEVKFVKKKVAAPTKKKSSGDAVWYWITGRIFKVQLAPNAYTDNYTWVADNTEISKLLGIEDDFGQKLKAQGSKVDPTLTQPIYSRLRELNTITIRLSPKLKKLTAFVPTHADKWHAQLRSALKKAKPPTAKFDEFWISLLGYYKQQRYVYSRYIGSGQDQEFDARYGMDDFEAEPTKAIPNKRVGRES